MKILLLAQFLPPVIGGEERHVWTLARSLVARGHDVSLLGFATTRADVGELELDGVRVVRVQTAASRLPFLYSDSHRPYALPIPDPLVARAIHDELSRAHFDVVHAHNWIVNSAMGPSARAKVPLVMTLHDYSHICATKRLMMYGTQRCAGPSLTRCLSCASAQYGVINGPVTLAANAWSARRRATKVARFAAVSTAVSEAVALGGDGDNGMLTKGLQTQVIPNFIPDDVVVERIFPTASDAPLLFVGDLTPDKGVQTLLDAYRLLDNPPRLVLVGQPARGITWDLPDGAEMTGALPHAEVLKLFRSARAVVVPSLVADACPTVVLEAMAAGRPVLAASSGGIVDLVVDGVTGLLFPAGDTYALKEAAESLLADPRTSADFGVAGRDRAREFTVSAVAARVEEMYSRAIAQLRAETCGVC
jgi:glycogen synthase